MELEEAIKILKYQLANRNTDVYTPINYEAMGVVLNHVSKQDKMIELMLQEMTDCEFEMKCGNCNYECERDYDQLYICNKQYFENKANEEDEQWK